MVKFPLATILSIIFFAMIILAAISPHIAFAGTDTYPTSISGCRYVSNGSSAGTCDLKDSAQDYYFDPWGEENRECTSYVAWMLHSLNGFDMPFNDNAGNWHTDASNLHYTVNTTPATGSVYYTTADLGHVAYVESVSSDGSTVTLEDYNSDYAGHWAEHTGVAASSADGYIHFKDTSAETNYLITRSSSNLQGKTGLNDVWATLSTDASSAQAVGTRLARKDGSGNIWAKDTLSGTWYEETNTVNAYGISSNYLLTLSSGTLQGKQGLNDGWTTLKTGVSQFGIAGTRISAIDTSGNLWVKDTLSSSWAEETNFVSQYVITPTLVIYRNGNNVYGKAGLSDGWSTLSTEANDVKADGSLIAILDESNNVWAKNGLSGTWYNESTPVTQYGVSSTYLITLKTDGTLQGKQGLNDYWTTLKTGMTNFLVAGTRIAGTDTSSEVWSKDTLAGSWYDESGSVAQYIPTSTLIGEP